MKRRSQFSLVGAAQRYVDDEFVNYKGEHVPRDKEFDKYRFPRDYNPLFDPKTANGGRPEIRVSRAGNLIVPRVGPVTKKHPHGRTLKWEAGTYLGPKVLEKRIRDFSVKMVNNEVISEPNIYYRVASPVWRRYLKNKYGRDGKAMGGAPSR